MALVVHGHLAEAQVIRAGSPSCPAVALTYDLCPVRTASGFDRELIDFLIMNKVPATFFMSGRWMAKHDAEVKELWPFHFSKSGRMARCMRISRCMSWKNNNERSWDRCESSRRNMAVRRPCFDRPTGNIMTRQWKR